MAVALDTLEKLVAYGYLDGNCAAPEEQYPSKKKDAAATPAESGAASAAAAAAAPTTSTATDPSKRKLIHVMLETLYECSMYKVRAAVTRSVPAVPLSQRPIMPLPS